MADAHPTMKIGEVFDRAVSIYIKQLVFVTFSIVMAPVIVMIIMAINTSYEALNQIGLSLAEMQRNDFSRASQVIQSVELSSRVEVATLILAIVISPLALVAVTRVVSNNLTARNETFGQLLRASAKFYPRALLIVIIWCIPVVVVFVLISAVVGDYIFGSGSESFAALARSGWVGPIEMLVSIPLSVLGVFTITMIEASLVDVIVAGRGIWGALISGVRNVIARGNRVRRTMIIAGLTGVFWISEVMASLLLFAGLNFINSAALAGGAVALWVTFAISFMIVVSAVDQLRERARLKQNDAPLGAPL